MTDLSITSKRKLTFSSLNRINVNAYLPVPYDRWNYKIQITDYWDLIAPDYVSGMWEIFHKEKNGKIVNWKLFFQSLIGLQAHTILDAGCGPGVISSILTDMGHHVTAIDLSYPMIDTARERFLKKDVKPIFKRCDLEFLPFTDEMFDIVICCDVLWSVLHPIRVLQQFNRVLRPGGKVIFIDRISRFPGFKYFNRFGWFSEDEERFPGSDARSTIQSFEHGTLPSLWAFSEPRPTYDLQILEETGFIDISLKNRIPVHFLLYSSGISTVFYKTFMITATKPHRNE